MRLIARSKIDEKRGTGLRLHVLIIKDSGLSYEGIIVFHAVASDKSMLPVLSPRNLFDSGSREGQLH